MASTSTSTPTTTNIKEITLEIPTFIKVYKDGTTERLQNSPIVPPTPQDPKTRVSSKDIAISTNPSISVRLFLPYPYLQDKKPNHNQKLPILVYFHGGGFVSESAFNELHQKYFNLFASQARVLVVSVEYRLAPETLLPAAYDDCWVALEWVASHVVDGTTESDSWLIHNGNFGRIFVGGDSAGANIAHNIVMRAGVCPLPGGVQVFGTFLSHPFFFGSEQIGSEPVEGYEKRVAFLIWNLAYPCASGGHDNPMINPLAPGAPSLVGLGCTTLLVCVAGNDLLNDRGVSYYEGVKKSGWHGEVELFEVEDGDHAFHIHDPESQNAKKMLRRFADFVLQ